jgi:dienelactone hydrolase
MPKRESVGMALRTLHRSRLRVAAVAWLKEQPSVDPRRIVVSGVSYGGIQTLLTAEKGLGIRAFVPFAPGAMSFANRALRERMATAVRNAKRRSSCCRQTTTTARDRANCWRHS